MVEGSAPCGALYPSVNKLCVCAGQAGLIQALAKLVKQGGMPNEVLEGLSEALKHLTASSQKNRDSLVASQALPAIIAHLQTGHCPCRLLLCPHSPQFPAPLPHFIIHTSRHKVVPLQQSKDPLSAVPRPAHALPCPASALLCSCPAFPLPCLVLSCLLLTVCAASALAQHSKPSNTLAEQSAQFYWVGHSWQMSMSICTMEFLYIMLKQLTMLGGGDMNRFLGAGVEGVQYNTARTLRHLALGCQPAHKTAALPAIVPLTQALQVCPSPASLPVSAIAVSAIVAAVAATRAVQVLGYAGPGHCQHVHILPAPYASTMTWLCHPQ